MGIIQFIVLIRVIHIHDRGSGSLKFDGSTQMQTKGSEV